MDDFFAYAARGSKSLYRRKPLVRGGTYHVFNRRDDRRAVFLDDEDRAAFVDILKRLLAREEFRDARGRKVAPRAGRITLLAFCILDNHFHLVLRQDEPEAISQFMRSLMSAYTQRFNRRHGRSGPLFDERYQARLIESSRHLKSVIAYVHANPASPLEYRWSSHRLYVDGHVSWCDVAEGLRAYGSEGTYAMWFLHAVEARNRRRQRR